MELIKRHFGLDDNIMNIICFYINQSYNKDILDELKKNFEYGYFKFPLNKYYNNIFCTNGFTSITNNDGDHDSSYDSDYDSEDESICGFTRSKKRKINKIRERKIINFGSIKNLFTKIIYICEIRMRHHLLDVIIYNDLIYISGKPMYYHGRPFLFNADELNIFYAGLHFLGKNIEKDLQADFYFNGYIDRFDYGIV